MATLRLGPFDLLHTLGKGASGEVWRAVHPADGVPAAVKVLPLPRGFEAAFAQMFREELRAVARLDHPGVVRIYDAGEVTVPEAQASGGRLGAGSAWLAMELASGGTLLDAPPGPTWAEVSSALGALLRALAHAHARGVVHRDVKPANVLRATATDLRPGWKLTDFGLASVRRDRAQSDHVCGTPLYMAPEQFRGEDRWLGPWTDLYSLGCLAWELVTGAPPYEGTGLSDLGPQHARGILPPLRPRLHVPEGLEGWLRSLLAADLRKRPQRAADASHALERLARVGEPSWPRGLLEDDTVLELLEPSDPGPEDLTLEGPPSHRGDVALAEDRTLEDGRAALRWRSGGVAAFEPPPAPRDWRDCEAAPAPGPRGVGLGWLAVRDLGIIGRETERDLLWSALLRVVEAGRPEAVVLRGASGTGKGRLARWLAALADELGVARRASARHHETPSPTDGLLGMVARYHRLWGLPAAEVERLLAPVFGGQQEESRSLAALLAADGTGRASPAERQALIRRWLVRLAADRPVVVTLEDADLGPDSLEWACSVLSEVPPRRLPVLLLVTVGEEAAGGPSEATPARIAVGRLRALPRAATLEVRPLPTEVLATFARERIGLAPWLASQLAEQVGGNPLFAVQVVRHWADQDDLRPGEWGFELRPGETHAFRGGLHAVWQDRVTAALAKVPGADGRALELAATLGAEVAPEEWEDAAEAAGVPLAPGLTPGLLARGLLVRTARGLGFAHPWLREVLQRAAAEGGRARAWHSACADALARREPSGADGRLGGHLLAAGRAAEAFDPLLGALIRAHDEGRAADAAQLHDAVLRALPALAPGDPRRARAARTRATFLMSVYRLDDARRVCAEALEEAERHGWATEAGRSQRMLGTLEAMRGNPDPAWSWGLAALATAARAGDDFGAGAAHNLLGDVCRIRGDVPGAEEHYLAALPAISASSSAGDALVGLAWVRQRQGRGDEARELLAAVFTHPESGRLRQQRAGAANLRGEVARSQGDLAEAEASYAQAVREYEAFSRSRTAIPKMNLALVQLARGRLAEAESNLEEARQLLGSRGRDGLVAACAGVLAACAAGRGDAERFDRELLVCSTWREQHRGAEADVAEALEGAGEAWIRSGDADRAEAAWREAWLQWGILGDHDRWEAVKARLTGG